LCGCAGTIGTFVAWQKAAKQQQQQEGQAAAVPPLKLAAYAGCITMRAAAVLQYAQKGRGMVAGDMIEVLGDPVLQHCGLLPDSAPSAAKL
jgi:NAD(P)H-hydrate repair Nnr-like enzyme with NAD(P)H-hydrate dehydratase domain